MRHRLRMLVAVTSALTVVSPATTGSALDTSLAAERAFVEQIIYATHVSSVPHSGSPRFNWSTDWCSAPLVGSTGRSFDFRAACRRHDFAYRNLKLLEQRHRSDEWNSSSRLRADRQFLADMRSHCSLRPWWESPTCHSWATTFYGVVRVTGGP